MTGLTVTPVADGSVVSVPIGVTVFPMITGLAVWANGQAAVIMTDEEGSVSVSDGDRLRALVAGRSVGPGLLDWPDLYDDLIPVNANELDWLVDIFGNRKGLGIEIGCGTGRLMIPLLARGLRLDGIDIRTQPLRSLAVALHARPAPGDSYDPLLICGDATEVSMPGRYTYAIAALNTWRYFPTFQRLRRHLRTLADSVVLGGTYAVELTLNPRPERPYRMRWETLHAGREVIVDWAKESYSHLNRRFVEIVTVTEAGTETVLLRDEHPQLNIDASWLVEALNETGWALVEARRSVGLVEVDIHEADGNVWLLLRRKPPETHSRNGNGFLPSGR